MLNLIFDLDETLIHTTYLYDDEINNLETDKRNSQVFHINLKKDNYLVTCRSYMGVLLRYCFKNFNVGFWTNGTKDYAKKILQKILLKPEYDNCMCIIGRTSNYDNEKAFWRCEDLVSGNKYTVNKIDGRITKPLSILFNKKLKKTNTLLIDNSAWNIIANPNNSIYVIDACYKKTDNVLFKLLLKFKDIKDKKINNVLKLNFDDFFNDQLKMRSCNQIHHYKKQKEYEIGDLVQSLDDNEAYCIIGKHKNKKSISYTVINDFTGDILKEKLDNKDIEYKILI